MNESGSGNHGLDQISYPTTTISMLTSSSTSPSLPDGYSSLGMFGIPLRFQTITPMTTFSPHAPSISSSTWMPFQTMAPSPQTSPQYELNEHCNFPQFPQQHQHRHHQYHYQPRPQYHPLNDLFQQHQEYFTQIQRQRQAPNWSFSPSAPVPPQQTSYSPVGFPSPTYTDLQVQFSSSAPTSTWSVQDEHRSPEPSQVLSPPSFHPMSPSNTGSPQSLDFLSPTISTRDMSSPQRGSIDTVDLSILQLSINEHTTPTFSPQTPFKIFQASASDSGISSTRMTIATAAPTMTSPTLSYFSGDDKVSQPKPRFKPKYQSPAKEKLNKKLRHKQKRKEQHLESVLPSHTFCNTNEPCCTSEAHLPSSIGSFSTSTSDCLLVSCFPVKDENESFNDTHSTSAPGTSNHPTRSPSSEPSFPPSSPSPPPASSTSSSSQPAKFVCEYCDRAFERQYNLNAHIRTHTDDRIHGCDICSKTFLRPYDLSRHQRIHNNTRPYTCQLCGRVFIRNDAIWRHYRSSHADHPDVPVSRLEKRKTQRPP